MCKNEVTENSRTVTGKVRYGGLDGLRTIACIGIVMMHMSAKGNNSYTLNSTAATVILTFADFVFLFMMISSFGMCCGYYEKFIHSRNVDLVSFYKKRYAKILPFFATVVLIDVMVEFSKNVLIEAIADVSLTFGLFPNDISVIGVGWFLGLIFVFYMIFPFFCALLHSKKSAWMVMLASLVLNYITEAYFGQSRNNIVYSFCFFVIGGIIYLYRDKLSGLKAYVTIPAMVVAIAIYYRYGGLVTKYIGINIMTIARLLMFASFIIFAITDYGCRVLHNRFTSYIGSISMEIYLVHMAVFRVIELMGLNTKFGEGGYNTLSRQFWCWLGLCCLQNFLTESGSL
jgi:peptidoglycan/LPS O-acetylase OafA/YrhL